MADFQTVATTGDIGPNQSLPVVLDDVALLVINSNGQFLTVENRCSHQDQPLDKGRIRNGYIFCPLHGMRFKLEDGSAVGRLTRVPLYTFETRVVDDEVQVKIDEKPDHTPSAF